MSSPFRDRPTPGCVPWVGTLCRCSGQSALKPGPTATVCGAVRSTGPPKASGPPPLPRSLPAPAQRLGASTTGHLSQRFWRAVHAERQGLPGPVRGAASLLPRCRPAAGGHTGRVLGPPARAPVQAAAPPAPAARRLLGLPGQAGRGAAAIRGRPARAAPARHPRLCGCSHLRAGPGRGWRRAPEGGPGVHSCPGLSEALRDPRPAPATADPSPLCMGLWAPPDPGLCPGPSDSTSGCEFHSGPPTRCPAQSPATPGPDRRREGPGTGR